MYCTQSVAVNRCMHGSCSVGPQSDDRCARGHLPAFWSACSSLKSSVKLSGFVSVVLPHHTYSSGQGVGKEHTGQTQAVCLRACACAENTCMTFKASFQHRDCENSCVYFQVIIVTVE